MQNRKKAVALNYDGANAPIVTAVGMGIIADKMIKKANRFILLYHTAAKDDIAKRPKAAKMFCGGKIRSGHRRSNREM